MKSIILNGRYMEEPEGAHRYIRERLHLSERYQNDLSSLRDCLGAMQNTRIEVYHSDSQNQYFQELLQVFADAGKANDDIIVSLQ